MGERDDVVKSAVDRRTEPRSIVDKYSSVEFSVSDVAFIFQFKIWETSPSGMSILVKENSSVLECLNIGDVLEMKYYPVDVSEGPITLKTEIKHITKDVQERIKGHYLVGLTISKKHKSNS